MLRQNFELVQQYKYSLTEIDNMIPYEREIYLALLAQYLREEEERRKARS